MDPHGWVLASDFCLGGKHMGSFIYSQRMKMSSSNLFLLPPKPTLSLGTSWPTPKVMSPNVTEVSIVYFSTFLCIPECLVARFWAMRWKLKFDEGVGGDGELCEIVGFLDTKAKKERCGWYRLFLTSGIWISFLTAPGKASSIICPPMLPPEILGILSPDTSLWADRQMHVPTT